MTGSSDRSVILRVLDIRSWSDLIDSFLRGDEVEGMRPDEESRVRLGRFLRPEDARRGAGGELLRRIALRALGGSSLADAEVLRDHSGKPFLPGFPNVHFNISHSGSIVVCAVDAVPIGVDVEMHRPVDPALPAHCLTPRELEWLGRDEADPFDFYTIWTIKESLLKGVGVGLGMDPLRFEVAPIGLDGHLWGTRDSSDQASRYQPQGEGDPDGSVRSALAGMVTRTADVAVGYAAAVSTRGEVDLGVYHESVPSNRTIVSGVRS